MRNLLKLFNEARPLIELQASFTTFRVTSGPWKNQFLVAVSMITTLIAIFLTLKYTVIIFDGEINMNIMMSTFVCISSSQYPLKSLCGLIKRNTFNKCLEEIQKSYQDREDDEELNRISKKYLMDGLRIWKLVYNWIICSFLVCAILISFQFRLSKSIGLIMDWSFLPSDSIFWNEIPYFFQFLYIVITALSIATADMTAIFLGLQIIASLNILIDYIKLINQKIRTSPNNFQIILNRHCKIIEKINLLNEAVYEISFIQMIITTIVLLLIFVFIRKDTMQITGYTLALCGMSQIFPLCVFGEMIKIKTEKLSEAFYEVNWYELSLKDQKTFLIILSMTQRQYGLKAAGMYKVDIYAFFQIMKMATSYCAILYTLSN